MRHSWVWKPLAIGAGLCGAFFIACGGGGSNDGGNGSGNGNGNTGADGSTSTPSGCSTPSLQITFAPMYSAYDGTHTFQVPAIVTGASGAVTWSASDSSMVQHAADPTSGGEMFTMQKAGNLTITATDATGACGTSALSITAAAPGDWEIGNQRYNNGVVLVRPDGGNRPPPSADGGVDEGGGGGGGGGFDAAAFEQLACTNCHGANSNSVSPFKDVSHTPEQTGGFSDDDLINIFSNGQIPDGGYFDPAVICGDSGNCTEARAMRVWSSIHQWTMTDDEKKGIIVYLRALTPIPQEGSSNFGGRNRDGGARRDSGGSGGPPDTGAPANDAASQGD